METRVVRPRSVKWNGHIFFQALPGDDQFLPPGLAVPVPRKADPFFSTWVFCAALLSFEYAASADDVQLLAEPVFARLALQHHRDRYFAAVWPSFDTKLRAVVSLPNREFPSFPDTPLPKRVGLA